MRPTAWLRRSSASGLSWAESKSKSTSLGRRSRTGSGSLERFGCRGLKAGASSAKPGSLPAVPLPVIGAPEGRARLGWAAVGVDQLLGQIRRGERSAAGGGLYLGDFRRNFGRIGLGVGQALAQIGRGDDLVRLRHGGGGEGGLRRLQRFLDLVRVEIEVGGILGRLGDGELRDGIGLLGFERVGIDFDPLDGEGTGGRAVAAGDFHAGNLVPAHRPGHEKVNDERDAERAENPALLQALHVGMDSKVGHGEF